MFVDDFFSFPCQLSAVQGQAWRRWLLGVAGVCSLPVAYTEGEKSAGDKGVSGAPISLCQFAPVPLNSRYHIWFAATTYESA